MAMMPTRKKKEMPMPPPGSPKTVIAIGIGKPKPGEMPDDKDDDDTPPAGGALNAPPSDAPGAPSGAAGGADGDDMGDGKISPERAIVIHANEHCKDCKNYDPMSGDCSKVSGTHAPEDACWAFFTALNEEPDADDQGGAPDNDADDMPSAQGAMSQ